MICPDCRVELIHHASKVIPPRNDAEAEAFDPELGGVVLEAHTCPECGKGASRVEEPPS